MKADKIYQKPQTTVVDIAFAHVLMASGGGPLPAPGNVNNTPEDGIIGG